ncbi:MAG: SusC/RagA family protein, partial [Saprospiraceae bacterium]
TGFSTITTNQGDLVNYGIELGLNANIVNGEFDWTLGGNISFNRPEIRNLGLPPTQFGTRTVSAFLGRNVSGGTVFKVPANIYIEGEAPGQFWGYQTNGIVTDATDLSAAPSVQGVDPQLGDIFYVDQNGDGNVNDQDLTVIGDPNPDFTFGINSNFAYKNFSLDVFFNGVQGNDIANGNLGREGIALGNSNNVRTEAYVNAWREGRTDVTYPRLGYPVQGDFTDRMVEDGSFIRLTYVTLGYTLPVENIRAIRNINFFVTGHNLLLLTDYSGFDPEVNSFAFDAGRQGVDWNSFPRQRSVSFGLNLGF